MRVLYDHQAFLQRYGGISRYFVELTRALGKVGGFEAVMPRFFSDNQYLDHKKTLLTARSFKGKVRLMDAANTLIMRGAFHKDFDVFHPTYFRPYFLTSLHDRPFVVTVHDMIHELFPGKVRDDGTRENKKRLCRNAARIIVVSANTRNDLCRILGIQESKVTVIHHATTLCDQGERRLYERPYILYVGERGGYKNFDFLLESATPVILRQDVDLVCAGGGELTRNERNRIDGLKIGGRIQQVEFAGQGALASLYVHAALLCSPSLYEGFGFPLIEAFACGCPVVASSASCFPEIAGDAAEYFDPSSRESLEHALERVLIDQERARALAALGKARLRLYSWQDAASRTMNVYQAAVG